MDTILVVINWILSDFITFVDVRLLPAIMQDHALFLIGSFLTILGGAFIHGFRVASYK